MSTRLWDRAAVVPAEDGRREPQVVALDAGLPTLGRLFSFMRDAELRWTTLRMRIEERTFAARGEQLATMDVAIRHPRNARVMTTDGSGLGGDHEMWLSDGETIWTYSGTHHLGTKRPIRNRPRGLHDLPGPSKVYEPLTALPAETLPELFIHPAGYCQNVLATGDVAIVGTDRVIERETIVVECRHPRAIERYADRPDFLIEIAVDRLDGVILRLVESMGGELTRLAEVVHYEPDARLPAATFDFEFPEGTTVLY